MWEGELGFNPIAVTLYKLAPGLPNRAIVTMGRLPNVVRQSRPWADCLARPSMSWAGPCWAGARKAWATLDLPFLVFLLFSFPFSRRSD
jgi:hypothetical protein